MKLRPAFLIWNGPQSEVIEIISALKDSGWDTVYCIGEEGEKDDIAGVVSHRVTDARRGIWPEGVSITDFPPMGKDVVEQLFETESILLTMMNRKVQAQVVDEKKHFYYEHLRYWYGTFMKYKPEVLILWAYPHNVASFVIYSVAKMLGIKTVFFFETWLSDRILMQYDYKEASPALKQALETNKGKHFALGDLAEDIKNFYEPHQSREQKLVPIYIKKQEDLFPLQQRMFQRCKFIMESVTDLSIFSKLYGFIRKFFVPNLKTEYLSVVREVDLKSKSIYVPLHRQPEGSTSPMGGIFTDQMLMLEILSASLPDGWVIHVKENIFQWTTNWHETNFPPHNNVRYKGYYQKIAKLKGVRFVPIDTDSNYLLDHSSALAVVSGRSGLESILRGKPALIFGYAWYADDPGTFRVNNVEACSKILKGIDEEKIAVTEDDATRFLASFDQTSFHGHIMPMSAKMSKLTKGESTKNIISVLIKELEIIYKT